MNPNLRQVAYDLYKNKFGKTPLEAGLSVVVYDNEAGGFYYSTSEKAIEKFASNWEFQRKWVQRYLFGLTITGLCLIIFVMIMLSRNAELCLLISKIWGFVGFGSAVALLVVFFTQDDRKTVFIPYQAPDNWLDD